MRYDQNAVDAHGKLTEALRFLDAACTHTDADEAVRAARTKAQEAAALLATNGYCG
ncbi:MAG: hypothetical protein KIT14_14005 [bacterium]|nr:hypothetical protein [bacterium]MCW5891646.1 hypothetical protein [bacterium]